MTDIQNKSETFISSKAFKREIFSTVSVGVQEPLRSAVLILSCQHLCLPIQYKGAYVV